MRDSTILIVDFDSPNAHNDADACARLEPNFFCCTIDTFESGLQALKVQQSNGIGNDASLAYVSWMFAKLGFNGKKYTDTERSLKGWLALLNSAGYETKNIISGERLFGFASGDVASMHSRMFVLHASPMVDGANRIKRIPSGCDHLLYFE